MTQEERYERSKIVLCKASLFLLLAMILIILHCYGCVTLWCIMDENTTAEECEIVSEEEFEMLDNLLSEDE